MSFTEESLHVVISNTRTKKERWFSSKNKVSYGPMGASSLCGRRERNDDCCWIDPYNGYIALSDGIGGAPYGNVISRVGCVSAMKALSDSHFAETLADDIEEDVLERAFRFACKSAENVLSHLDFLNQGSGATLLLATVVRGEQINILSAGDSAAIKLSSKGAEMICGRPKTKQEPLASGIGFQGSENPRRYLVDVDPGDVMIFCTDGVTDALDLTEIESIVNESSSAPEAAVNLTNKATDQGWDNATAVIVYIN